MIVSHYSTSYIFFFLIFFGWIIANIFSKFYNLTKRIKLTTMLLSSALIFFWYFQVTEVAFSQGVGFIQSILEEFSEFFVEEARTEQLGMLFGQKLTYPVLSAINLAIKWSTFILIGIGILGTVWKYKRMINIFSSQFKKPSFLKRKIDAEYVVMGVGCSGLLAGIIIFPYISKGYEIDRLFPLTLVMLCLFLILGCIFLSKYFKVKAYLIILVILIPSFMISTGTMYQITGANTSIILNSDVGANEREYVHDQESCAARWLMDNTTKESLIYSADRFGERMLISQGGIPLSRLDYYSFINNEVIDGYVFLFYNNVVNGQLTGKGFVIYDMHQYEDRLRGKSLIYSNGYDEIYK
jgi:uncharacterized membrane protein